MINCTFEHGNKASLRHVTVGCLVVRDSAVLLVKRTKGLLEAGKWALPGGFVDRDETTRQATIREVGEETGWTIKNLQLLRINDSPDRPHEDRQNVDFIYIAHADQAVSDKDDESDEIRWFALDQLPPADTVAFDHFDSIALYVRYRETPFPLPVLLER